MHDEKREREDLQEREGWAACACMRVCMCMAYADTLTPSYTRTRPSMITALTCEWLLLLMMVDVCKIRRTQITGLFCFLLLLFFFFSGDDDGH